MAEAKETDKLMNGRSSILDEEDDVKSENAEDIDLFISEEGDETTASKKSDKTNTTSKVDVEASHMDKDGSGVKTTPRPESSHSLGFEGPLQAEDVGKSVTFADNYEVYDLNSNAATPISVRLDNPVNEVDIPHTETQNNESTKDSPAVLPVVDESSSQDNSSAMGSTALRPSDLVLSTQDTNKEQPSSTSETTQEGEHPGHRHFDVSNVDESVLRKEIENKEQDLGLKSDMESRPLLDKIPNALSDEYFEHSMNRANQDTIGPLENPVFLRMLNYSVSQPVAEDDGFAATSCLDLENFDTGQPPSDMDGGWAWVVLFAAFFSLALTGATMFAAGVLMTAITEKTGQKLTEVSWIGAVHISTMCMSGPFVGIILTRIGAKWTAFFAGIVLSVGLASASIASTLIQLIITHGLLAGIGSGFILNTMFVIVGQYFNRYRGLACGILATGSGAGMLAGGNILTALFNKFGLSGTYLLWGGVTLHSTVFALLLRPSPEERLRWAEKKMAKTATKFNKGQDFQGDVTSMMSGLNSVYGGGDQNSVFSGRTGSVRRFQRYPSRLSRPDVGVAPLLKAVLHKDMSRSTYSVATNRSVKSHRKSNANLPASPTVGQNKLITTSSAAPSNLGTPYTPSPGTSPSGHSPVSSNPLTAQDQADHAAANERLITPNQDNLHTTSAVTTIPENDTADPPSSPTNSRAPSDTNRSFRKRLLSSSSQAPSYYTSTSRLSYRPSIREQLNRNDLDNESLASTLVSHLQPHDALAPRYRLGSRSISSMMGSIASFPTALAIVKDDLARVEAVDGHVKMTLHDHFVSFLDSLRLLRNRPFLVFISTCLLWALADSPFSLFLPTYAESERKSTPMQASSLYTAMGFGSMCGRFLSGLVASDTDIGPVLLHIGCLGVASLLVTISPWITTTYPEQLLCSGLFGVYTGSLVPLSSLITIELLGIGELGLGFGFLSMAQGIGYLVGPPLLGACIQAIGFQGSFMVIGVIFLCASTLAMMIAILLRNAPDEDIHDSFDDLERALGRISDTESKEEDSDEEISPQEEELPSKPAPATSLSSTSIKKKEEPVLTVEESSLTEGERKEDPQPEPTPEGNSAAAAAAALELETITEEG